MSNYIITNNFTVYDWLKLFIELEEVRTDNKVLYLKLPTHSLAELEYLLSIGYSDIRNVVKLSEVDGVKYLKYNNVDIIPIGNEDEGPHLDKDSIQWARSEIRRLTSPPPSPERTYVNYARPIPLRTGTSPTMDITTPSFIDTPDTPDF